jgi:hypothetical protein
VFDESPDIVADGLGQSFEERDVASTWPADLRRVVEFRSAEA